MKAFQIFVAFAMFVSVSGRRRHDPELDYMKHRLDLMEEGMVNFVYESKPSITYLQNEVSKLKGENDVLREQVSAQEREIDNLKWMASENKKHSLTREERDLVTELKWTVFDLKMANEILQEENCKQNTVCNEWSDWTKCSVTCGSGTRIRHRTCEKTGRFASMCMPSELHEEPCESKQCDVRSLLPQFDCPDNYTSFQGYCFRFSGRQDARLLSTILCEKEDAHLVYINNQEKQEVVWDYLNTVAPEYMVDMNEDFSKREYWDFKDIDQKTNIAIDGVRKHRQTDFFNWREQEMTYFNWAVGQPRNDKSDGDYCVTLNVLTGEWYMLCCSVTFFYVCETEVRVSD